MRRDPGYLARERIRYINGQYVQIAGDYNALAPEKEKGFPDSSKLV